MGCCESCDNGGPCDCGGNCNGSCGKPPGFYPPEQYYTAAQAHDSGIPHPGDVYNFVMSGEYADNVRENVELRRDGEYLTVRYRLPGEKGFITATVPFAPVMTYAQNLAMAYGAPETRPNTVMGYAPILALITSQLASQKVVEDAAKRGGDAVVYPPGYSPAAPPPPGAQGTVPQGASGTIPQAPGQAAAPFGNVQQTGPFDLTSLLRMIPGLTMMMGVSYDSSDGLSDVAQVVMGACGCGVPCDGIQQNSPFMDIPRVVRRNRGSTPWNAAKFQRFWRQAPRVNDQADNMFGRSKSPPPSATPPNGWPNAPIDIKEYKEGYLKPQPLPGEQVSGYYDDGFGSVHQHSHRTPARYYRVSGEVPCKSGGTCGKDCCGH